MSESPAFGPPVSLASDDLVVPFSVDNLDVRGRLVRFGPLINSILARHNYPEPVGRLLGEAIILAALIGTALKFDGKFLLQTQSTGPINLMVVDLDTSGNIRACAKFDQDSIETTGSDTADINPFSLLGDGHLALTIDPGSGMNRYQGVVPLTGPSLSAAADHYFRQSEQIPTLVRLAVGQLVTSDGQPNWWRAGGIMIQYLPTGTTELPRQDLDPGDIPEGHSEPTEYMTEVSDDWVHAEAIVESVGADELTDPTIDNNQLLYRLFHEPGVRVYEPHTIHDKCRCNKENILSILTQFSEDELNDMIKEGEIEVTCEFCSTVYSFERNEIY